MDSTGETPFVSFNSNRIALEMISQITLAANHAADRRETFPAVRVGDKTGRSATPARYLVSID